MSIPNSVVKTQRHNGQIAVTFTDNVDRVNYTLAELTKAALRDTGKVILPMVKRATPVLTGRLRDNWSKWVRKTSTGVQFLQIGVYTPSQSRKKGKRAAPHAHLVLLGHATVNGGFVQGNNFFEDVVQQNIGLIREIQGKYLSAIDDAVQAEKLVAEEEGKGEEDD